MHGIFVRASTPPNRIFFFSLRPIPKIRCKRPGARFSKASETFRARKAIFRSSVCKNGHVYTPETPCMK